MCVGVYCPVCVFAVIVLLQFYTDVAMTSDANHFNIKYRIYKILHNEIIHSFICCKPQALIPPIAIQLPNNPFAHRTNTITNTLHHFQKFQFPNPFNKPLQSFIPRIPSNLSAKSSAPLSNLSNTPSTRYGSTTPCNIWYLTLLTTAMKTPV